LQGLAGIAGAPGEPGRAGEPGIPGPSGVCIFYTPPPRAVYYYGISVIVPDFSFKIRITDLPPGITLSGFVPTFFSSSSWLCKCFVKIALDFPV